MQLDKINPNANALTMNTRHGRFSVLFSYGTPVAYRLSGVTYIPTRDREPYQRSVTTAKHVNTWHRTYDNENAPTQVEPAEWTRALNEQREPRALGERTDLSAIIRRGQELTEAEVESLVGLLTGRCSPRTTYSVRSALLSVPHTPSFGIFSRVHLDGEGGASYCAGQSYPDEIRTVRDCLLGARG